MICIDLPSIIFGALLPVCYHRKESRDDEAYTFKAYAESR
jgi:hypothetical protein